MSIPILSRVVATFAQNMKYSAYRSREITWLDTSTAPIPSTSIIVACTSIAFGPSAACVPTAPVICPTTTLGRSCSRRSICRPTSLAQMANRRPYVVGTPCCPWVRPMQTRDFCFIRPYQEYSKQATELLIDQIECLGELQPGSGIEDIIACCTIVHPPPGFPADLRYSFYHRHHIVTDLAFYSLCPFQ